LARFITGGMLCTHQGLSSQEVSAVQLHPRFWMPDGSQGEGPLYVTTSWLMWSEYLPKERCFKCSYCFVGLYKDHLPQAVRGTVGMSPVRLLDHLSLAHMAHEPESALV